MMIGSILVIILLIIAALLSCCETAMTAATPGKIHKLKNQESPKTIALALKLLKSKEKVISTILVASNIVVTVATTIAAVVINDFITSDGDAAAVSASVMSILLIVFVDVIPKAVAVAKAEIVAIRSATLINIAMHIMLPINYILNCIVRVMCRLLRIDLVSNWSAAEEVRGVIEHHHNEGNVIKVDRDMLGGVLDLRHTTVHEIMVHRSKMVTINADLPIEQIAVLAIDSTHTRIPLWSKERDNIVAVLHVRQLLKFLYRNKFAYNKVRLEDFSSKPWFIPEHALLIKQLTEFKDKRNHIAIVVDEYGNITGMVTVQDILEEIVGSVGDEDRHVMQIIKKEENKYIVDGVTTIRDINRELNIELQDDSANTVSGLMMHHLERLPNIGDAIDIEHVTLTQIKSNVYQTKSIMVEIRRSTQGAEDDQ